MNKKININPSSTKWLEKDDRVVADYFCDLGFRSLKQILDMRVFDLMNMQGLNAVRVEEVIICLYKWLNPNTAIDEAKFLCHVLRHTFATRMCESGLNVKVVQSVLGHADVTTTLDIYVTVTNDLKKREITAFETYLKTGAKQMANV